jgi:hypothetical protein
MRGGVPADDMPIFLFEGALVAFEAADWDE